MRIETKQGFGVNLGLVGLNRFQNSLREITGKVRTMPGGVYICHKQCHLLSLDGTVWYNMRQGERRGTEVDLLDFTYDGKIKDRFLSGGLGQLTDGAEGNTNFRLDHDDIGIKGYEWVGWRNDTFNSKPIEILFKFDQV